MKREERKARREEVRGKREEGKVKRKRGRRKREVGWSKKGGGRKTDGEELTKLNKIYNMVCSEEGKLEKKEDGLKG